MRTIRLYFTSGSPHLEKSTPCTILTVLVIVKAIAHRQPEALCKLMNVRRRVVEIPQESERLGDLDLFCRQNLR
jgi:hypothetical protein